MERRKLIIEDVDGTEYEVSGTGGGGGVAPTNSVNSQSIEDESIQKQDLDKSIQEKLDMLEESNVITEQEMEDDWAEAMNQAGLEIPDQGNISDEEMADEWNEAMNEAQGEGE